MGKNKKKCNPACAANCMRNVKKKTKKKRSENQIIKRRVKNAERYVKHRREKGYEIEFENCVCCSGAMVKGQMTMKTECCFKKLHLVCYEKDVTFQFENKLSPKQTINCAACIKPNDQFPFLKLCLQFPNLKKLGNETWHKAMDKVDRDRAESDAFRDYQESETRDRNEIIIDD